MTGQLTQVDLAEELGLSRETVNKILNGHTRNGGSEFSADTIARVLAAAEAAGYARPGAPGRPSMAEIGRQLGLSHVAVHAVLRGRAARTGARVSAETRAAVLAKAKELGYSPPPLRRRAQ